MNILKSPMILIALGSLGLVFGMPYLMDSSASNSTFTFASTSPRSVSMANYMALVDPEMRAEVEERQKSSPLSGAQASNPLQNFDAAAWLAGTSEKKDESSGSRKSVAPAEKGVTR